MTERSADAMCGPTAGPPAAPGQGATAQLPLALPTGLDGPPVIALGAWFKSAACVAQAGVARFGELIGDLDSADACRRLEQDVERLLSDMVRPPAAVAHDLHPDFHSTRVAAALAARLDVPAVAVQHHHAHVAAVLAEHRHRGAVIGLALDGVGLGSDGTAWGGELLRVDGARFARLGHLALLPLPGGDRAAREPWRMAAAVLARIGRSGEIASRFRTQRSAGLLPALLARDLLCPPTSSLGRVFDAAAGLLGVCEVMQYEAEAAITLERVAACYQATHGEPAAEADAWHIGADGCLNLLPLLARLADEQDAARGAARFHATLIAALEDWVMRAAADAAPPAVVLSGGCFHNRILSAGLADRLRARGLTVLEAQQLSPGDAALALGQAWVALHHLNGGD